LEKKQRQLAIALPPDIRDRLQAAADTAGHSLAEEIRRRLALTFAADAIDPVTRELAADIMHIADDVTRLSEVPWHSNPKAQQALAVAIQTWLEDHPPPDHGPAAASLFGPDDPPTLGRSIAKLYERLKAVRKETEKEIIAALSRKGKP
jgi:hypothetical protein